jgi:O-antigen/teichoic acid export membrane protein
MITELKKLLKHTLIYGFFNVLMRAVSIILLPIYTRFLVPEKFGVLELLTVTAYMITIFLGLGLNSAIIRYYAFYSESEKRESVVSTCLIFLSLFAVFAIFLFLFESEAISILIFQTSEYTLLIKILLLIIFFQTLYSVPLAIIRAKGKPLTFSVLLLTGAIFKLLLNIFFLAVLKWGLKGILIGNSISTAIVFIGGLIAMREKVRFSLFSVNVLKKLLFFGMPIVPTTLAFQVISSADRYILQRFASLKDVGLYSVAYKVGIIMGFIVMSFQTAWGPFMFTIEKKENAKELYSKVLTYSTFMFCFVSLALSLFSKEIVKILTTEQYYSAYKIVPIIVFSYVFYGLYYVVAVGVNIKNKTYYFPLVLFIAAIINIGLNFILIPKIGIMGAAYATLFSFVFMAFGIYYFSNKYYPLEYEVHKIFTVFTYWILSNAVISLTSPIPYSLELALKITILLIFMALIFKILSNREKQEIKELVLSGMRRFK